MGEVRPRRRRKLVTDLLAAFKAGFAEGTMPVRPTVCVDVDGVLAFFIEAALAALNAEFGTEYRPDAMHHYWFESWLDDPAQVKWINEQFSRPIFYVNLAPDFGGIAALNALRRGGVPIRIVTDRPTETEDVTREWLERWRVPFDGIDIGPGSKRRVARSASVEQPLVFIDDDPRKAAQLPRPGVELLMPRRPWTPKSGVPNAIVFDTWSRVLARFGVEPDITDVPQLARRPTS